MKLKKILFEDSDIDLHSISSIIIKRNPLLIRKELESVLSYYGSDICDIYDYSVNDEIFFNDPSEMSLADQRKLLLTIKDLAMNGLIDIKYH